MFKVTKVKWNVLVGQRNSVSVLIDDPKGILTGQGIQTSIKKMHSHFDPRDIPKSRLHYTHQLKVPVLDEFACFIFQLGALLLVNKPVTTITYRYLTCLGQGSHGVDADWDTES